MKLILFFMNSSSKLQDNAFIPGIFFVVFFVLHSTGVTRLHNEGS